MKAILVKHKFPIPEELQPKAKAIVVLSKRVINERQKASPYDYTVKTTALQELKTTVYREVTSSLGIFHTDYPIWAISDSGKEIIGYRYEFQEEG